MNHFLLTINSLLPFDYVQNNGYLKPFDARASNLEALNELGQLYGVEVDVSVPATLTLLRNRINRYLQREYLGIDKLTIRKVGSGDEICLTGPTISIAKIVEALSLLYVSGDGNVIRIGCGEGASTELRMTTSKSIDPTRIDLKKVASDISVLFTNSRDPVKVAELVGMGLENPQDRNRLSLYIKEYISKRCVLTGPSFIRTATDFFSIEGMTLDDIRIELEYRDISPDYTLIVRNEILVIENLSIPSSTSSSGDSSESESEESIEELEFTFRDQDVTTASTPEAVVSPVKLKQNLHIERSDELDWGLVSATRDDLKSLGDLIQLVLPFFNLRGGTRLLRSPSEISPELMRSVADSLNLLNEKPASIGEALLSLLNLPVALEHPATIVVESPFSNYASVKVGSTLKEIMTIFNESCSDNQTWQSILVEDDTLTIRMA